MVPMGYRANNFLDQLLCYHSLQQVAWSPFGMRAPLSDTPYTRPFRRYSPLLLYCLWMGGVAPNAGKRLVAGKTETDTSYRVISRVLSTVHTHLVLGEETVRTSSDVTGMRTRAAQYPSGQSTRYIPQR